jgi:hypothetical protein
MLVLLTAAPRLPAPVSEVQEKPQTTATPDKAEGSSANVKRKPRASSEDNSLQRFDGTWQRKGTTTANGATYSRTSAVIIRNGKTAQFSGESISTLQAGRLWPGWPKPYNVTSPVTIKSTAESTDLKADGSNLRIHWPAARLDWTPRNIPIELIKKGTESRTVIYVLNGEQLIVTDGKTTGILTRLK